MSRENQMNNVGVFEMAERREKRAAEQQDMLARCALLAECKAVQSGDIWCTTPDFFQQSMALADFMLDLHAVFTGETADPDTLHFLTRIT